MSELGGKIVPLTWLDTLPWNECTADLTSESGTAGLHDVRQCKDLKRLLHFRGRHTFHGVPGRVWERKDMCHHPVLGYSLVEMNFGLHRPS